VSESREDELADAFLAPATSAQRGLWLTHLLDQTSTAYNVPNAFELAGPPDIEALRSSLVSLYGRHEALRTSFLTEGDDLYQVIRTSVSPAAVLECRDVAADETLEDAVRHEFAQQFDLFSPPLFRVRLFADCNGRRILTLVAHHMIIDARSLEIIWNELSQLYEAIKSTSDVDLGESPLQLGDYAEWEQRWIDSQVYKRQVDFFRKILSDAPAAISFPVPRRQEMSWHGGVSSAHLDRSVTLPILATAAKYQATPFVAMLTLFAGVLHRWSAQDVVVVGTSVSVRSAPGLERAVGMYVNSLPLPTRWGDDPTFEQAITRVRDTLLDCLSQHRCPFERLVTDLRPPREPHRTPIFQVMFGMAAESTQVCRLGGETVAEIRLPVDTARFELTLDIFVNDGDMRLELEWSHDFFDAESACWLIEDITTAARLVSRESSLHVGEWLEDAAVTRPQQVGDLGDDGVLGMEYYSKHVCDDLELPT
jgi:hypothetical protein